MDCGRPDCNRVHHGPVAERCEGSREKYRARRKRLRHTPGTYEYNWKHGIGAPGAKRRELERKLYWTPGTGSHNRKWYGGDPLEARAVAQAKLDAIEAELAETEALIERLEGGERG